MTQIKREQPQQRGDHPRRNYQPGEAPPVARSVLVNKHLGKLGMQLGDLFFAGLLRVGSHPSNAIGGSVVKISKKIVRIKIVHDERIAGAPSNPLEARTQPLGGGEPDASRLADPLVALARGVGVPTDK